MNSWIESLNGFGDTWFHVVSSVVAQSVVVFALATIATKLLSKHSASLRFWVWQAAALKLMIVPFSMIIVLPLWPAAQTQEIAKATSHVDAPPYADQMHPMVSHGLPTTVSTPAVVTPPKLTAMAYALVGCCCVSSLQILSCLRRKYRLAQFLKSCELDEEQLCQRLQELAKKLGLKTSVRLMRGDVQVPLVTGILSPAVILPADREFNRTTFDQVVLHELAHVKRCDLLWVWLPEVLRILLFFHPLVYWIQQQAKVCSELACDELVLSIESDRRDYAKTLLELARTNRTASANSVAGMTA